METGLLLSPTHPTCQLRNPRWLRLTVVVSGLGSLPASMGAGSAARPMPPSQAERPPGPRGPGAAATPKARQDPPQPEPKLPSRPSRHDSYPEGGSLTRCPAGQPGRRGAAPEGARAQQRPPNTTRGGCGTGVPGSAGEKPGRPPVPCTLARGSAGAPPAGRRTGARRQLRTAGQPRGRNHYGPRGSCGGAAGLGHAAPGGAHGARGAGLNHCDTPPGGTAHTGGAWPGGTTRSPPQVRTD